MEYLGRYTHKIAISNQRIKSIDGQNVTFDYKDYRVADAKKQMTLTHQEFIRRFALHILPKRFTSSVRPMGSGLGCENPSLWFFEQHPVKTGQDLETAKTKAFTRETKSKSFRKSRKEAFFT